MAVARSNRKGRISLLALSLAFFAVLVVSFTPLASWGASPRAENGELDLRGWSLESDGAALLNGGWQLYWGKLLESPGLGEDEASVVGASVPGVWKEAGLPGRGYATYRLTVHMDDIAEPLGLSIPAIAPAG